MPKKLKWKRSGDTYSGFATVYYTGNIEIGLVAPTQKDLAKAWDMLVGDLPMDKNKVKPVRIVRGDK